MTRGNCHVSQLKRRIRTQAARSNHNVLNGTKTLAILISTYNPSSNQEEEITILGFVDKREFSPPRKSDSIVNTSNSNVLRNCEPGAYKTETSQHNGFKLCKIRYSYKLPELWLLKIRVKEVESFNFKVHTLWLQFQFDCMDSVARKARQSRSRRGRLAIAKRFSLGISVEVLNRDKNVEQLRWGCRSRPTWTMP